MKKWLFLIILGLTFLIIILIILLLPKTRYNNLVISNEEWNKIISTRNNNSNLKLDNIKFNDYNLIIDEDSNAIYYSIVNSKTKYNPIVDYNSKYKIAFNKQINSDNDEVDVIIYNNKNYRIYKLVLTNMPILSINYKEQTNKLRKIPVDIYLFDNDVNTTNKVLKSLGDLTIIKENNEYILSLKKESLGRNKRDNEVSLFGMEKHDEYLVKVTDKNTNYINLFINNKYVGKYTLKHLERRDINDKK